MKVGDYVRTKNLGGSIEKIIEIIPKERTVDEKERYLTDISSTFSVMIEEQDIIKSNPNIIDLIEVGDYVNGIKVDFTNIDNKLAYEDTCIGFYDGDGDITLFANDIKSIVTKEMMESVTYYVK